MIPRGVRWVLAISLGSVLLVSLAVGATVGAVVRSEKVSFSVRQAGGATIDVALPAGVADVALAAAEWVPASALPLEEIDPEALEWLDLCLPAAQRALDQLASEPDFVLFELSSPGERVLVLKRGRALRVTVDSGGERVDVSLPLSTVRRFARRLRHLAHEL